MQTFLRFLSTGRALRAPEINRTDMGSVGIAGAMMLIGLVLLFALHN